MSDRPAPWPKCLVLGAAGFMGTHLCAALSRAGYRVRAFDRPVAPHVAEARSRTAIEWMYGDFVNRDDLGRAIADCNTVFHLISTTLPKTSNDNPYYDVDTNLKGTLHLLDLARAMRVQRIVFVSSGGTVYGRPASIPISESHATNPICSYGVIKLAIEKYLSYYSDVHGVPSVVLRVANPYGEGQRPDAAQGAIAVFLAHAMAGREIEIWGDGSVVRDYLHVSDLVDMLIRASQYQGNHVVVNVGSGRGRSITEILDMIQLLLARPVRRVFMPARAFDVPVNVLDCSLARQLFNWVPRVSLEDGLAHTIARTHEIAGK